MYFFWCVFSARYKVYGFGLFWASSGSWEKCEQNELISVDVAINENIRAEHPVQVRLSTKNV